MLSKTDDYVQDLWEVKNFHAIFLLNQSCLQFHDNMQTNAAIVHPTNLHKKKNAVFRTFVGRISRLESFLASEFYIRTQAKDDIGCNFFYYKFGVRMKYTIVNAIKQVQDGTLP